MAVNTITLKISAKGIKAIKKFANKVIDTAKIDGKIIFSMGESVAPLTLISLLTLQKQVRKFEKYIIPINPLRPKKGKTIRIKIMRTAESKIAVLKQKSCWSSPFKSPSAILSKYIKGTIGAKSFTRRPTPASL